MKHVFKANRHILNVEELNSLVLLNKFLQKNPKPNLFRQSQIVQIPMTDITSILEIFNKCKNNTD